MEAVSYGELSARRQQWACAVRLRGAPAAAVEVDHLVGAGV